MLNKLTQPAGAGNPAPPPDPTLIKILPNEPPPGYKGSQPDADSSSRRDAVSPTMQAAGRLQFGGDPINDEATNVFDGPDGRKLEASVYVFSAPTRSELLY